MKQPINKPVTVTAMRFGPGMRTFPRRMEFDGHVYEFIDSGIKAMVKRGETITQILTMSDGRRNFHLRSDNGGGVWTLLDISA